MAGITVHMRAKKQHSLQEIHQQVHLIAGAEQISKVDASIGDATLWLLVYEKYFFRSSSYASLTVLLSENEEEQTADIVSSGGGQGLANHSLGANRKFTEECIRAMEAIGFSIDEERSDDLPRNLIDRFIK